MTDGDARRSALALLPKLPKETIDARLETLVQLLDKQAWQTRITGLEVLTTLSSSYDLTLYYRKITELLNDPEDGVRFSSLQFFRQQWSICPEEVQPHLARIVSRIEDPDMWVRWAVIAFINILPVETLCHHATALAERLEHEDGAVRSSALMSLSRLPPSELEDKLQDLTSRLTDEDPGVRWGAINCLGKLPSEIVESVIPEITERLHDNDVCVRDSAVNLLHSLPHELLPQDTVDALASIYEDEGGGSGSGGDDSDGLSPTNYTPPENDDDENDDDDIN